MLRLSERSDVTEIRKQTCISHKVSSSKSFYLTRSLLLRDLNAHVGNNNMIWMGVIGRKVKSFSQGCNEVRWRPGHEASLAPPCSTLRSFGSKCTVLKKVLMTLLGLFGAPRSDSAPGELFPPFLWVLFFLVTLYLGMVFTIDEGWNMEIDTRIGKANAVFREFYCGSFQTPQSCDKTRAFKCRKAISL